MHDATAYAGKSQRRVVATPIGTAFVRDDPETAHKRCRQVTDQLRPRVARLVDGNMCRWRWLELRASKSNSVWRHKRRERRSAWAVFSAVG